MIHEGFINPRWLALGFLNDQQYERKDSRNKNKKYNTDLLKKQWRLVNMEPDNTSLEKGTTSSKPSFSGFHVNLWGCNHDLDMTFQTLFTLFTPMWSTAACARGLHIFQEQRAQQEWRQDVPEATSTTTNGVEKFSGLINPGSHFHTGKPLVVSSSSSSSSSSSPRITARLYSLPSAVTTPRCDARIQWFS